MNPILLFRRRVRQCRTCCSVSQANGSCKHLLTKIYVILTYCKSHFKVPPWYAS